MTTILITGITGFAGSNLVHYFSDIAGVRLVGHSRDKQKGIIQFKDYKVEFIDELTSSVLDETNVDCIIHLAGIAHDLSNKFVSDDYYAVNDLYTRSVYDQFLQSRAACFIYLSSIKALIDTASSPITENIGPMPSTDYGKSKAQAEAYIQNQPLNNQKRFYLLRPCMIHGPGNKGNLNLLYKFVKSGMPFPFGAFRNQRSFLNIDNFNFIIHQLIEVKIPSGIYHLSDSGFLSTADLVRLIGKALNKKAVILNLPTGFVKLLFKITGKKRMLQKLTEDMMVSNEKLLKQLNKTLPVSIEEGVLKTIRSFDH